MNNILMRETEQDIDYNLYITDAMLYIGNMHRQEEYPYNWILQIPSAGIKLKGQYRYDLIEEAQILYNKFHQRNNAKK